MNIGLIGLKGVGKDTVSGIMKTVLEEQGYTVELHKFADTLKDMARNVFGDTFDDRDVKEERVFITPTIYDAMVDELDKLDVLMRLSPEDSETMWDIIENVLLYRTWISPREFQQLVGTDIARAMNPNVWVDIVKAKVDHNNINIFTDVRFSNELLDKNVLIVRDEVTPSTDVGLHVSEKLAYDMTVGVATADYKLYNNCNINSLELKVRMMLSVIMRGVNHD